MSDEQKPVEQPKEKRKRKARQYYLYQPESECGTQGYSIIGPNPSEAACLALAPKDGAYEVLVRIKSVTIRTVEKKEIKLRG